MEPRKVIGSIDTSEFLVALAASLGFILALGSQGIDFLWVAGLLIGGMVAAPLAAWLVRHVPPRMLGSLVGGAIVLTNSRTLLRSDWIDASDPVRYAVYAAIYAVWAAAVVHSFREFRKDRVQESADALAAEAALLAARNEVEVVEDVETGPVGAGRPQDPRD
jgi:hypothetical protein